MRAPLVLLAALLLLPVAAARVPGERYSDDARDLAEALDRSVLRARVATVEHAFGDRDARETAHVMRVEAARLASLVAQMDGIQPPRSLAREHATLRQAAVWYAEGVAALEDCFRHDRDEACRVAGVRIAWGEIYRPLAGKPFS